MSDSKKNTSYFKKIRFFSSTEQFEIRHKKNETNFTRQRKLPFTSVLKILLRKSVKSLQLVLNEWCRDLDETISASALCQARQKFSHTAFIELLEECVIKSMYEDGDFERYKGHRLLAIDGSTLRLPTSKELIKEFGSTKYLFLGLFIGHAQTTLKQLRQTLLSLSRGIS